MDPAVIIALITIGVPAFLATVATPPIVAYIQARNLRLQAELAIAARRAEIEQAEKRADQLEARATERAAAVAKRAEETSALLVKATVDVREVVGAINIKADEIHVLTNSSYTASLQATLEAVQAKLVVLLNSIAFKREHNMDVDAETTADVTATKKKMEELTSVINERLRQDVLAKELKAKELLMGKQAPSISRDQPLPVADDRAATATERTAAASERVADAAERSADKIVARDQLTRKEPSP